jgi:serine phosphatase RsbU (regulator of sigma subunit)
MRVSFQFRREPAGLLESADRVLPATKEPDMFATLALLRFDSPGEADYAIAGHVPILHYRDRSRGPVLDGAVSTGADSWWRLSERARCSFTR